MVGELQVGKCLSTSAEPQENTVTEVVIRGKLPVLLSGFFAKRVGIVGG